VSSTAPGVINLRPATDFDIDWVVRTEHAPENEPFITRWTRARHVAALRSESARHYVIVDAEGERVGYVILQGLDDVDGNLELTRIVVADGGHGFGRSALREVKRLAFDEFGAHRLWLDVVEENHRARALYASEGFVEEGVLREAARRARGRASLVLMSILVHEHRGRERSSRDG
jgi:diamine N-acetyltransferase